MCSFEKNELNQPPVDNIEFEKINTIKSTVKCKKSLKLLK